jgi:hypothetical protein
MNARHTLRRCLAAAALLLAGCASVFGPRSIDIEQSRLEQALARRFPFDTRWLGLVDISAAAPRLRLLPERDRIAADLTLSGGERLFAKPLEGALTIEGALRYEPSDASLRLVDVRVDRFSFNGLPDLGIVRADRLGALVAEQALDGLVLYTLTEAQQDKLRAQGLRPGAVHVTSRGLAIALEPLAAE